MSGMGGAGPYVTTPRGPTSRFELKLAWDYPTYTQKKAEVDGRTTAVQARRALSAEEAFAAIAGEDRRPLLVLRECLKCNGTDDALMTRKEDNERTMLMSRWFHCVKLPPDVLEDDHPFHVLFADAKPGHLFIAQPSGAGRTDLTGQQSRTELWKLMESALEVAYESDPDAALERLLDQLDRFDKLDSELVGVKDRLDRLIENGDGDSSKAKKLHKELADLEAAKAKARADAIQISELKFREENRKAGKTASASSPASAGSSGSVGSAGG
jgi:hypothetical protein